MEDAVTIIPMHGNMQPRKYRMAAAYATNLIDKGSEPREAVDAAVREARRAGVVLDPDQIFNTMKLTFVRWWD